MEEKGGKSKGGGKVQRRCVTSVSVGVKSLDSKALSGSPERAGRVHRGA